LGNSMQQGLLHRHIVLHANPVITMPVTKATNGRSDLVEITAIRQSRHHGTQFRATPLLGGQKLAQGWLQGKQFIEETSCKPIHLTADTFYRSLYLKPVRITH